MASVDRRPNGKWRARWREYPGGPQKAKHFNRKLDAERFLVDVQHRMMTGAYVSPDLARVTLDSYAEEFVGRLPWRRSSAYAVANALTPVRTEFGRRPLGTIRKGDVQAFVTKLAQSRTPGGVAVVFQHFNALLAAAVEDGLIARNPAKGSSCRRGRPVKWCHRSPPRSLRSTTRRTTGCARRWSSAPASGCARARCPG